MKNYQFYLLVLLFLFGCGSDDSELKFRLGLVADPQYADEAPSGKRLYRESTWKLSEAIDTFNHYGVEAVQTLGDVIDKNWSSYDSILPVYDNLNQDIANYHALGNHDFSVDSNYHVEILNRLEMPSHYYTYEIENWKFIVLDATDYATYSKFLHQRTQSQVNEYLALAQLDSNDKPWNGAIGQKQQRWLEEELQKAEKNDQKVILFAHHPIQPQGNSHNIWNDHQIIEILESSNSVFAYINGHNHAGNYVRKNGIHYITIFGMVDTSIPSYAILDIYQDSVILNGFGNQKSLNLAF